MIKSLTVTNYIGESLKINLNDMEPKHGLLVTKIEGIGPTKATINKTDLATSDGSKYNSSKLQERNILLTFKFVESTPELTDNYVTSTYNIENTRQRTYKYFPAKRECTLTIESDNRNAKAVGYVESNEPNIFNTEPDEGCQISIICPDPYFYSNEPGYFPHITEFSGLDGEFEWLAEPDGWSNESLTENLTELGAIKTVFDQSFPYFGDQETGVYMNIHFIAEVTTNILIIKRSPIDPNQIKGSFLLEIEKFRALMGGTNFLSGDTITVNTTNNPGIKLFRSGEYYNILNAVSRDSDWFKLDKGTNSFTFTAYGNEQNIEFRIEDYTLYEGV